MTDKAATLKLFHGPQEGLLVHLFCRECRSHYRNFPHSEILDVITSQQVRTDDLSLQPNSTKIDNPCWKGKESVRGLRKRIEAYQALVALVEAGDVAVHRGFRMTGIGMDITPRGISHVINEGWVDVSPLAQDKLQKISERAQGGPETSPESLTRLKDKIIELQCELQQSGAGAIVLPAALPPSKADPGISTPSHVPASLENAQEGILVFLNLARFSARNQQPNESRLLRFLMADHCLRSEILPVCGDKKIPNPFFTDQETAKAALEALEKKGFISAIQPVHGGSGDLKSYRLTGQGLEYLREHNAGREVAETAGSYVALASEVGGWRHITAKYGNGSGCYEHENPSGRGFS